MDQYELGRLVSRVDALESEMSELRSDVKSILAILNRAQGGWKVMMLVAGFAGAVGAGLAKLLPFIWTLPK